MVFSSPLFLWALGLISIPIIIHLFQFRRYKKLYFSDVSLLKEIKAQSQTKNELKNLLILLVRILFIALIVLAFARPIIPAKEQARNSIDLVSIYVDNSFSMQAEGSKGQLMSEAIQIAFEIADKYPESMRFQLITNAFDASEKRTLSMNEFESALDEVKTSPVHRGITSVLRFQNQANQDNAMQVKKYLISDFSQMLDSTDLTFSDSSNVSVISLRGVRTNNVSIDSAWLETPLAQQGMEQTVQFRVHNYGDQPIIDQKFDVTIEDRLMASPILTIEANSYVDSSFRFIPEAEGYLTGEISVEDYPVTFDNAFHFSIPIVQKMKAIEISGVDPNDGSVFKRLFSGAKFSFTSFNAKSIIYDSLAKADLLIVNQVSDWNSGLTALLREHLESGKNILIVLPESPSESVKQTIAENFGFEIGGVDTSTVTVERLNYAQPLFTGVFEGKESNINLPSVSRYHIIKQQSFAENIFPLPNNRTMLASNRVAKGNAYIIPTPLKTTNTSLQDHALFVPTLINMAAISGIQTPLSYRLETQRIRTRNTAEGKQIVNHKDSAAFIPGLSYDGILLNAQVENDGIYHLYKNEERNEVLAAYAFNYNRSESKLSPASDEAILTFFEGHGLDVNLISNETADLKNTIEKADLGSELWPLFIGLALLLLIVETSLLKLFAR